MRFFFRTRWWTGVALLIVFCFFLYHVKSAFPPDNSLSIWFLETDPNYQHYKDFQDTFGNDEIIALQVDVPETGINLAFAKQVNDIVRKIESVHGVQTVHSIFSVQDAYDTEEGLKFNDFITAQDLSSEEGLQARIKASLSNRITTNKLISSDGKKMMLWVELKSFPDYDNQRSHIVHRIQSIVDSPTKIAPIAAGGLGIIYTALNDLTQRDISLFFSASYLLIFGLLWFVFRRLAFVLVGMFIVTFGIVVTLGLCGLLGVQLNMITAIIPTIVIIIGVSDIVHFPSLFQIYRHEHPEATLDEITIQTMTSAWLPCFLTCCTNVIGFLSLATAPISGIRQFGIFSAIGIAAAFIVTFVVMAIVLPLWPPHHFDEKTDFFQPFLSFVYRSLKNHATVVASVFIILFSAGFYGASKLVVDTYSLGYLPKTHRSVMDNDRIVNEWGHYMTSEMTIVPKSGSMTDPDIIRKTEKFINAVEKLPEISRGDSIVDVYRRMEEVWVSTSSEPTPLSNAMVSQLSLMIESDNLDWNRNSADYNKNYLKAFTTENFAIGRITLTGQMLSANQIDALWAKIDTIATDIYATSAEVKPAGYGALYSKISNYIITSQIRSFFYTVAVIFVILLFWTRSLRFSLIALIPNIFPIVMLLGLMGFAHIPLDLGTAIVAAIVLGIATDDTIHFIHHWQEHEKAGYTWYQNLTATYSFAGRAAIITSLLFIIGFPVMMLSELKTVFYFGLLTTFSAGIGIFADLFLMPLLLKIGYPNSEKNPVI